MALEEIFKALEEQAEKESEQTLEDARAHAAAILEEAHDEADAIKLARAAEGERRAESRAQQLINSARLEGKKRVAAAKERAVSQVFDIADDRLIAARGADSYPKVFAALATEAVCGLEGKLTALVDPADVELATSVFGKLGLDVEVRPELATNGGLVVTTHGGRILRRNTFEDRMEKVRRFEQARVAEMLFS